MAAAARDELVFDGVCGEAGDKAEEDVLLLEVQVGPDERDRAADALAVGADG